MSDEMKKENEAVKNFAEAAQLMAGQKCAVLCARYQYRGILAGVADDCLILANAMAVEVSGTTAQDRPQTEDAISGDVIIKNEAIEILYQPQWCYALLPHEDGYEEEQRRIAEKRAADAPAASRTE
jgi:hypothetical protein